MRTYSEYKQILELWELGFPKKRIALMTGIPRATVSYCIVRYGDVAGLDAKSNQEIQMGLAYILQQPITPENGEVHEAYAYVLGLYLGDGCISKANHIYKLRISLDAKYPNIMDRCSQAIQVLLPDNKITVVRCMVNEGEQKRLSSFELCCYYKHWPVIFPQHGAGRKHDRQIKLETWQEHIVDTYPLEFFRGLYHSDGSRFSNVVKGKDYPRYAFTNSSPDICNLFTRTCDTLNLHWTNKKNRSRSTSDIFISRRADVTLYIEISRGLTQASAKGARFCVQAPFTVQWGLRTRLERERCHQWRGPRKIDISPTGLGQTNPEPYPVAATTDR